MFSKPVKYLLVATSVAPIVFVYWLVGVLHTHSIYYKYWLLIFLALLMCACKLLLNAAKKKLDIRTIKLKSVKSADHNVISFLFIYLLPVFDFIKKDEYYAWAFIIVVLFVIIINTNTYHFNPLLSLVFGFKFYEVATTDEFTYIMITKQELKSRDAVTHYVQLTSYVIMDVT
ncbi:MAG: hypothetical protein V4539_03200 [Bacteroidota bacterium]